MSATVQHLPCTCGHKVNVHSLVEYPRTVGACLPGPLDDGSSWACLCQDYREDVAGAVYIGAIGWMWSDAPKEEAWKFASWCVDYYQDETDLARVNYRDAWNLYLPTLAAA